MKKIDVGCYYFPNYHPGDARNTAEHGPGWSEWEVVKRAVPRWEGHRQPKIPVWGYEDESDPGVMARKIAAARRAGIDYFIFDYYHYNDGTFLSGCLDQGFLPAVHGQDFRFALMWANHDWLDIHPCSATCRNRLLYNGMVTPESFRRITDEIIQKYFLHPNYYRLDGQPYFSVYYLQKLIDGFGSTAALKAALADFRARAKAAGLPGVHLNAVVWGSAILPGEEGNADPARAAEILGFDSMTSYVWIHHFPLPPQREIPYLEAMKRYFEAWEKIEKQTALPYFPNVTAGWDPSPRTRPGEPWDPAIGYPYTCTLADNTPQNFRLAMKKTLKRAQARHAATLNVNCWNEWTEGSMLEPEAQYGTGYLDVLSSLLRKNDFFPVLMRRILRTFQRKHE